MKDWWKQEVELRIEFSSLSADFIEELITLSGTARKAEYRAAQEMFEKQRIALRKDGKPSFRDELQSFESNFNDFLTNTKSYWAQQNKDDLQIALKDWRHSCDDCEKSWNEISKLIKSEKWSEGELKWYQDRAFFLHAQFGSLIGLGKTMCEYFEEIINPNGQRETIGKRDNRESKSKPKNDVRLKALIDILPEFVRQVEQIDGTKEQKGKLFELITGVNPTDAYKKVCTRSSPLNITQEEQVRIDGFKAMIDQARLKK